MNRQFPPEIVQLIIEASLDPYDVFDAMDNVSTIRYAILKSYSLLNSTWHGASQPELIRSVELRTIGSMAKFLEMAERRGGTVEGVRDLYVSVNYDGDSSTLRELPQSTPHLLNFYCDGGTMDLGDLAPLQMLRRLDLFSVYITGSQSSSLLSLPRLQRLSLTNLTVDDSASHFLTPAFLPQLRRIDTDDFDSIAPLVPHLEIIAFDPYYGDYTPLLRAKSLLLLPLPHYPRDRLTMLSTLPSLPPFLHIEFLELASYGNIDFDHEVALALEEVLESKNPGLRIILLNDHGIGDSVKSLIQRLQERGIRVQLEEKYQNFDGAIVEMEKIRAKEQRAAKEVELRRR